MNVLPLVAAAAVLAFFGWGWLSNLFQHGAPEGIDKARMEQELKDEGAMKQDGTVKADPELDPELNALTRELNAIEKEDGVQLDGIDKLP